MVTLADALAVLYPAADPMRDYRVFEDRAGVQTLSHFSPALGPPPTAEQLAAVTEGQVRAARGAWVNCLAFLDRLPPEKQAAVWEAGKLDPSAGLLVFRLTAAQTINAADPQVAAGVDALVAAGVLDAADRAALLA